MFRPFSIIVLVVSIVALAEEVQPSQTQEAATSGADRYLKIKQRYQSEIKPIFQKKCFDCHSDQTRYPWYYQMFGVKQFIDHDIVVAKESVDMSNDFPFSGKGDASSRLKAIGDEVADGDMPPVTYRMIHSGSALTVDEKQRILDWVGQGLRELK